MDHYEIRKYAGWHHHMLTTMLAHFFLWHLKWFSPISTLNIAKGQSTGESEMATAHAPKD